ncbi:hypothetical protein MMC07_001195 [Pseudocyphellaria aurata]|nr:hypothetical protein [Pseudocyphellaria aurata]
MALLLLGPCLNTDEFRLEDVAVLSAWGWSICVSAIAGSDPNDIRSGIAVCQGVPMRSGERKRFIVDTFHRWTGLETNPDYLSHKTRNHVVAAQAGDKVALTSWTRAKKTRYFLSVTDVAFEVSITMSLEPAPISDDLVHGKRIYFDGELRVGLRCMQEMYWNSIHLGSCGHPASLGQITTLPNDTCVFRGLDQPGQELPNSNEGSVYAGLVAGNSSARWILLCNMLSQNNWRLLKEWYPVKKDYVAASPTIGSTKSRSHGGPLNNSGDSQLLGEKDPIEAPGPVVFVRGKDCCFQCAIETALKGRRGRPVGLVL